MSSLRFGVLTYLNCLPATLGLERGAVGGEGWSLTRGTPAELNQLMRDGHLDVSLVSAVEYVDNEDAYTLLDEFSLWCDGPVQSVTLYSGLSREELQDCGAGVIAVTPESASSVTLTEILLPNCQTEVFDSLQDVRDGLTSGRYKALLLIGDGALAPPDWTKSLQAHDLSQWWADQTHHPMTFAVWVARQDLETSALDEARSLLSRSLDWGKAQAETVLKEACQRSALSRERLMDYFSNLEYRTTPESELGFSEFRSRVKRHRVFGKKRPLAGAGRGPRFRVSAL